MKQAKLLFFLLSIILFSSQVYSQNILSSQVDLSTIKVDQLSDDQIKQIVKKAESSGMSQEQLEAAAMTKGMKPSEIQKLRDRISKLNLDQNIQKSTNQKINSKLRKLNVPSQSPADNTSSTEPQDKMAELFGDLTIAKEDTGSVLEQKVFGYNLFNNKQLTFEPSLNVPTPVNYQIGPGDQINIDVWGASQQSYQLTITPDGSINIENVGVVYVNGLTIESASKRIINKLSTIYSGLIGQNPNTFAQVTLGNLRSIKVSIVGEVRTPGTYTLPSLASVFNALYACGGPSFKGSFRNIGIYRDNKLLTTLDVYDFLVNGDQKNNIRLQDMDIIMIKPFNTRIELSGEVKTSGFFEMKDNENVIDLIRFAGGFTERAYTHRLKIIRNTDRQYKILDLTKEEFGRTKFNNGDVVSVEPIINRFENRVEIQGAVYRPGQFELAEGMTLKRLIEKAEGLRGDAFLSRAIIYRMKEDFTIEALSVDLKAALENKIVDEPLIREDFVKIFSIFDLQEDYSVQIDGEILNPGRYPFSYNLTISDLLAQAGGFKESASLARIEVARRIKSSDINSISAKIADVYLFDVSKELSLSDSASKFILEPFDRIFVRRSPGYEVQTIVYMKGEALYPGAYSIIKKDERISDILQRAGGLTKEAYPKGAKLTRRLIINQKERSKILRAIESESSDSLKFQVSNETEQSIGIDLEKILKEPHSEYDLILQDGDILEIPKELQTVRLSGAFLYPITVRYNESFSLRNYASLAGGFSEDARPGKAFVIYANGSVDKTSNFLFWRIYPKVEPGAEIIVPKKVDKKSKMTIQETMALVTMTSAVSGIIIAIINLNK